MKSHLRLVLTLTAVSASAFFLRETALAQSYGQNLVKSQQSQYTSGQYSTARIKSQIASQASGQVGVPGLNARNYVNPFTNSGPQQSRSKPFAGLQRGPTVSPYLSISSSLNGATDYYNIVRPQQQQAQANLQQNRQLYANRQRLNAIAAQGAYSLQGDPNTPSTGHTTTYMYMGNYQTTGNFFPGVQGLEKMRIDQ